MYDFFMGPAMCQSIANRINADKYIQILSRTAKGSMFADDFLPSHVDILTKNLDVNTPQYEVRTDKDFYFHTSSYMEIGQLVTGASVAFSDTSNLEEILDVAMLEIDVIKVYRFMNTTNWTWADGCVPLVPQLIEEFRALGRQVIECFEKEQKNGIYDVARGGITAICMQKTPTSSKQLILFFKEFSAFLDMGELTY